jgi:hypothetical protein
VLLHPRRSSKPLLAFDAEEPYLRR